MQRRKYSIAPLQISSPMQQKLESKSPIITKDNQKIPQKQKFSGLRSFFSCKYHQTAIESSKPEKKRKKVNLIKAGCSVSLCNIKESSKVQVSLTKSNAVASPTPISTCSSNLSSSITSYSSSSSSSGSFRGMHLRKFSGCYECHMVVDPITGISSVPSLRRCNIFPCPECGDIFGKLESLELHQAIKHAVSELGPEDSSRNIVEIIFKSSWLKKHPSPYKIQRILKIHNTKNTISKFESYRDSIKLKADKLPKNHSRCIADGNELLRFHSTTLKCPLGLNRSSNLCISTQSPQKCNVCDVIKDGFDLDESGGIRTMATSGRAHDVAKVGVNGGNERAMIVCRVIAGRVGGDKSVCERGDEFDSFASNVGVYSSYDELCVFDSKAILPCFVIIYKCF